MKHQLIIVIDFGGQYNQLIARRVRECNVYCEIYSYKTDIEKIKALNPMGIIITGGPNSCYLPNAPTCSKELFQLGIPVLGLCYGAQLMNHLLGGKVERATFREYGKTTVKVDTPTDRLKKLALDIEATADELRGFNKLHKPSMAVRAKIYSMTRRLMNLKMDCHSLMDVISDNKI